MDEYDTPSKLAKYRTAGKHVPKVSPSAAGVRARRGSGGGMTLLREGSLLTDIGRSGKDEIETRDIIHEESWSVVSSASKDGSKGTAESTPDVFFADVEPEEEDTPPPTEPSQKSRKPNLRLDLGQLKKEGLASDEFSLFVEKKPPLEQQQQPKETPQQGTSSGTGSHVASVSVDELFGSTRKHLLFEDKHDGSVSSGLRSKILDGKEATRDDEFEDPEEAMQEFASFLPENEGLIPYEQKKKEKEKEKESKSRPRYVHVASRYRSSSASVTSSTSKKMKTPSRQVYPRPVSASSAQKKVSSSSLQGRGKNERVGSVKSRRERSTSVETKPEERVGMSARAKARMRSSGVTGVLSSAMKTPSMAASARKRRASSVAPKSRYMESARKVAEQSKEASSRVSTVERSASTARSRSSSTSRVRPRSSAIRPTSTSRTTTGKEEPIGKVSTATGQKKHEAATKDVEEHKDSSRKVDAQMKNQMTVLETELMQWMFANAKLQSVGKEKEKRARNSVHSVWTLVQKKREELLEDEIAFLREQYERRAAHSIREQAPVVAEMDEHLTSFLQNYEDFEQTLRKTMHRVELRSVNAPTYGVISGIESAMEALESGLNGLGDEVPDKMEDMSSQLERLNGLIEEEATVADRCIDLLKKLRQLENEEQSIRVHRAQKQRDKIVPWLGTA